MSDNWIIIFPDTVDFALTEEAGDLAVTLFKRLTQNSGEVKATVTEKICFIDCGANFEQVVCPDCGMIINPRWWSDRMQEEYEAAFPLHPIELTCCHAKRALNDLKYEWPQGFARFSVAVRNPNISDLSEADLTEFEFILGCKVRKVIRRI